LEGIGLEGHIAQLVDDQQFRSRQKRQLLVDQAAAMGLGQHRHQRRRCDELHVVILAACLTAETDGKVRLAPSGRTEQEERIAMSDPTAGRKLPDLPQIQEWLSIVDPCALRRIARHSR